MADRHSTRRAAGSSPSVNSPDPERHVIDGAFDSIYDRLSECVSTLRSEFDELRAQEGERAERSPRMSCLQSMDRKLGELESARADLGNWVDGVIRHHVIDDETFTQGLIAFQQARALVQLLAGAAEGGDIQTQGYAEPQGVYHVFSLLDNELNRLARRMFPAEAVPDASVQS
jgi:hypothetical protein